MPPVRVPISWSRWPCCKNSSLRCSSSSASLTSCSEVMRAALRVFFCCKRKMKTVSSTRTSAMEPNMTAIFRKLSATGW